MDDGPVRLVGRLAVEPYHPAMPGGLWERFPDGVRPWRVRAVRTADGRALGGAPPVEQGGGGTDYVVDLKAMP